MHTTNSTSWAPSSQRCCDSTTVDAPGGRYTDQRVFAPNMLNPDLSRLFAVGVGVIIINETSAWQILELDAERAKAADNCLIYDGGVFEILERQQNPFIKFHMNGHDCLFINHSGVELCQRDSLEICHKKCQKTCRIENQKSCQISVIFSGHFYLVYVASFFCQIKS